MARLHVAVAVLVVGIRPQEQSAREKQSERDQARDGGTHQGGGSGAVSGGHLTPRSQRPATDEGANSRKSGVVRPRTQDSSITRAPLT